MTDPITQTVEQLRGWADEAEETARKTAEECAHPMGPDDLRALALMMEAQQTRVDDLVALSGRAVLIAEMARTFALNQIKLPGSAVIEQFIRDYIDQGNWGPIPWPPEDIRSLTTFLRDKGYANIDGFVNRPAPSEG